MEALLEKYRRFKEWQERPYQVAEKSPELHRCRTCGEEYQGNFCPRCGQSFKIGRYSFKNALMLFFDVWGMGNRGMFHTLCDLILRPGYMIRDYISGMQMAYYPPFKLLFLLTALLLVVESGVNLRGKDQLASFHEQTANYDNSIAEKSEKKEMTRKERWDRTSDWYVVKYRKFKENNPPFFWLSLLFIVSGPLYLFFRKSPNIPDMRFSELLIAMVYTWGMCDIYEIVLSFFGAPGNVCDATFLLPIIPLKQLSGFKWWKTILYVLLSYLLALVIMLTTILAAIEIQIYLEAS